VEQYSRRRYTIEDIADMARLFISLGVYEGKTSKRIMDRIDLYEHTGEEDEPVAEGCSG
jgi:hypothetical protein